jgi:hypothetical protein
MKHSHMMANLLAAAVIVISGQAWADSVTPIDLRTWAKQGPAGNGNWVVASDGSYVTQTINGDPTFFVSPGDYLNTTIRGTFSVNTTSDDDYIGFVFGYTSPQATSGAGANIHDYILFDWKQANQDVAKAGFTLSRVQGTIDSSGIGDVFWTHNASNAALDVWGTDLGSNRGWADNTQYSFELVYQSNLIQISIAGGAFGTNSQQIFSVTPDDVGETSFATGKFGFYNYSQQSVVYTSFTEQATPVVPTPGAFAGGASLLALLAGGVTLRRRRALAAV